jgi:hypothetical protein
MNGNCTSPATRYSIPIVGIWRQRRRCDCFLCVSSYGDLVNGTCYGPATLQFTPNCGGLMATKEANKNGNIPIMGIWRQPKVTHYFCGTPAYWGSIAAKYRPTRSESSSQWGIRRRKYELVNPKLFPKWGSDDSPAGSTGVLILPCWQDNTEKQSSNQYSC